jgi:hypothetical protein
MISPADIQSYLTSAGIVVQYVSSQDIFPPGGMFVSWFLIHPKAFILSAGVPQTAL